MDTEKSDGKNKEKSSCTPNKPPSIRYESSLSKQKVSELPNENNGNMFSVNAQTTDWKSMKENSTTVTVKKSQNCKTRDMYGCSNNALDYKECTYNVSRNDLPVEQNEHWKPEGFHGNSGSASQVKTNSSTIQPTLSNSSIKTDVNNNWLGLYENMEKDWPAGPHKELNENESPFQYSKVMFMINPGVLLEETKYRFIVSIKQDGKEIGKSQLDFAGIKKWQGTCTLKEKHGDELHTPFVIKCKHWNVKVSLRRIFHSV